MTLDKQSPVPLYYQLAELLREQIRSGRLTPGDQLPSERELSEQYAISRMTTRQAIAYLVQEGTLVARHGLGTFVAAPKLTYDALNLIGFTEEIIQAGGTATSRVIEQAVAAPPERVAAGLRLAPGQPTVRIVRLRLDGPTPLLLETIFIPAWLLPGLEREDMSARSLYSLLEQQGGIRLEHARQTLEATVANDYESRLLGVAPGTAMILLEGVTYAEHDQPVEYFKAIYRGDRFKFEFESRRSIWLRPTSGSSPVSVLLAAPATTKS